MSTPSGGSTLAIDAVSRWFANVVAVNDVTMSIGPGITGLLGIQPPLGVAATMFPSASIASRWVVSLL